MDDSCFDSALKSLTKTQHKRRFLQILLAIREGASCPERAKKLHRAGSLKYIVSCLQQDCRKAVDISLSILGNCSCLDANCAKSLVQQHKILPALCTLLEKYDEDSIRGRVFRIVGNLSDVTLSKHIIERESSVIAKIVEFVKDDAMKSIENEGKTTEATVNMALRTIRKFATKLTLTVLLHQMEVLKAVGLSLIKYISVWEENNTYESVINELIKILLLYSNYKHITCIAQLKNTGGGDALACLPKLINKFPERTIKITINFIKTCSLKSDIPIDDIAKKLMKGIDDSKNIRDGTVNISYLKSLCKICEEVGCRDQIKSANIIPYLVGILKGLQLSERQTFEQFHCILSSIIMCKYDHSLVKAQVKCGIISVLTQTLGVLYGSGTIFKTKHKYKRQSNCEQRQESLKKKRPTDEVIESDVSTELSDWSMVFNSKKVRGERSASPSSSSDDLSSSPNSPHYPIFNDGDDLSDSDNYSPICSDTEETGTSEATQDADIGDPSDSEPNDHLKDPFNDSDQLKNKNTIHFMVMQDILLLLKWYTTIKPTIVEITDQNLIRVLTIASTDPRDPYNSLFSLLLNILCMEESLLPLMISDYITSVYSLTIFDHDSDCSVCRQVRDKAEYILSSLKTMAESGFGRGEIAHILLRSKDQTKKEKIALSIPYIIGNKTILRNLLVNCEGINIMMDMFKSNETYQEQCIHGICEIAKTQLKIKSPKDTEDKKPVVDYIEASFIAENCSNIVTFKLEGGDVIKADRDFLSDNSDYFNRLLSGSFKESQENVIILPNVKYNALNTILHFLNLGKTDFLYKFSDLKLALDSIALADQFMLLDLANFLAECVEQIHLSFKTLPEIYRWSIESGTSFLRVECIALALVEKVSLKERYMLFQKLLGIGYSEILAEDIKSLLTQFLGICS